MIRFYYKSFGCRTNQIEIESIVEKLIDGGAVIDSENFNYFIINSCCVTEKAERELLSFIRKVRHKHPYARIILTGCAVALNHEEFNDKYLTLIKNTDKHKIAELITGKDYQDDFFAINGSVSRTRAFIKIQDGCNLKCSYCIVPFTRNIIKSKKTENVIDEIKNLVENGYKEIVLSGTRLGSYRDNDSKLDDLIEKITGIKGDFKIRLSSLHPSEVTDKLIEIMSNNERFCNYFHLPLQSGSDKILKDMKRPYSKKQFYEKVKQIRRRIKDAGIYSDVIVGFPTETEKEFNESLSFIRDIELSGLHVFTYSKRPFTESSKFKDLSIREKQKRSEIMRQLDRELRYKFKLKMIGKQIEFLTLKHTGNFTVGLSTNFIDILVKNIIEKNRFFKMKASEIDNKYLVCE